ncbi:MAG: 5-formyltetrahydrofolate cyclo-ligase [Treponema sp.]|uniref:5-formyltetrahydrofolate cyclo-ligase n=1 Tax=Treponema sp. TaxID=166 RepID=UPI0025E1E23D|nr:5-formyltetrahydrofolate cyclo-ligase [Treponema sp.]MBR0495029.1 5-formyltetrahydrofolate cyclo-ligase [Treponema sp.]
MILNLKKDLRKKMKEIQKSYLEKLSCRERHSLAENLCEKVTALDEYKKADLILAYIPDKLEADCIPVILDALEKGKKVAVPKVDFEELKNGRSRMDFYFLDGKKPLEEQLETGAFGIREPKAGLQKFGDFKGQSPLGEGVADKPTKRRELALLAGTIREATRDGSEGETSPFVLVPGVAFTKDGKRLGHGKGFYDIYIEEMRKGGAEPFLCGTALPCQIVDEIPTDEHDVLMDKTIICILNKRKSELTPFRRL